MKNKVWYSFFLLAFIIKILMSVIICDVFVSLMYGLILLFVYAYFINKKSSFFMYLPFIMIDFIVGYFLCYKMYGLSVYTIIFGILYFVMSSGLIYFFIIDYVGKQTSNKTLTKNSNIEVDKALKALENDQYDMALKLFSNAIKEHKKNYLGYMGMCNTLERMDQKNLKKIKYYKKKCIKYAPKELKKSIGEKYDA